MRNKTKVEMREKKKYIFILLALLILLPSTVIAQEESVQKEAPIQKIVEGEAPKAPIKGVPTNRICKTDKECGTPFWRSYCKKIVVVPSCDKEKRRGKFGMCTGNLYLLENSSLKPKAISKAESYLKASYGREYFNEHFTQVKVIDDLPEITTKAIDINLSKVKIRPNATVRNPFWFRFTYNISWTVNNETLSTPFPSVRINFISNTTHECSLKADTPRVKFKAKEVSISRREAKKIALKHGVKLKASDFSFGLGYDEHLIPVWRGDRGLKSSEVLCKYYPVGIKINAFSGEVVRKFTENPCVGPQIGGGRHPPGGMTLVPPYTVFWPYTLIVGMGITAAILIYTLKKKKD